MKKKIILFVSLLLTTLLISVALWIYQDLNTIVVKDLSPDKNSLILYIKDGKTNILFDVGDNERELMIALEKNNLALKDIDYILISHKHPDHVCALLSIKPELIDKKTKIIIDKNVYNEIIQEYGDDIKKFNIIQTTKNTDITKNIIYTKSMESRAIFEKPHWKVNESFLLIKKSNKLNIITGCAHPKIYTMGEEAKRITQLNKIEKFAGGLGGFAKKEARYINENNIEIYPTHCTHFENNKINKIKQFPIIIK